MTEYEMNNSVWLNGLNAAVEEVNKHDEHYIKLYLEDVTTMFDLYKVSKTGKVQLTYSNLLIPELCEKPEMIILYVKRNKKRLAEKTLNQLGITWEEQDVVNKTLEVSLEMINRYRMNLPQYRNLKISLNVIFLTVIISFFRTDLFELKLVLTVAALLLSTMEVFLLDSLVLRMVRTLKSHYDF